MIEKKTLDMYVLISMHVKAGAHGFFIWPPPSTPCPLCHFGFIFLNTSSKRLVM